MCPRLTVLALALAGSSASADREGITFEANGGIALLHYTCSDCRGWTHGPSPGGLALGVAGWADPSVALGFRASTTIDMDCSFCNAQTFVGLSGQFWLSPVFWLGGGLGIAYVHNPSHDVVLFAADARVGVVVECRREHCLNLSLEVQPASAPDSKETLTAIAFTIGYQHL